MRPESGSASLPPIDELNHLPRDEFAAALRPLFEAAGPLADGLFERRPYTSYVDLLDRAEALVADLPEADKVRVISAHPRIGEDAAAVRRTSDLSYREQGYDRETAGDPDVERVYRRLAELNRAYEDRFGFRFVVFVNGRTKAEIVPLLETRLEGSRDEEMETALGDMLLIARDRLRTLLSRRN